jgi:hypothetical protein
VRFVDEPKAGMNASDRQSWNASKPKRRISRLCRAAWQRAGIEPTRQGNGSDRSIPTDEDTIVISSTIV